MAGSRIIVEAPIYEEFLKRFAAKAQTMKVGDPRDPHTVIGPLIRSSQCPMIDKKIKDAVAAGARLLTGGKYRREFLSPDGGGGRDAGDGCVSRRIVWPRRRRHKSQ